MINNGRPQGAVNVTNKYKVLVHSKDKPHRLRSVHHVASVREAAVILNMSEGSAYQIYCRSGYHPKKYSHLKIEKYLDPVDEEDEE